MKSEIGTMPAPVVIPKSMEQVEREHQGLCDLIRRDVRRIVAEELDKRGLVDRGTNPVSTEEFIRRNPELHGLVRDAVRGELEFARADGERSSMPSLRLIFSWSFLMYRWYSAMPCTASASEAIALAMSPALT